MITSPENYKALTEVNDICECGHIRWEHTEKGKPTRCMYGNGKSCDCKEFKQREEI